MDIEEKIELITRLPTEEVITNEDLRQLLETNDHPIAYNGFEPSGMMHLGTGLISGSKMMDLTKAGVRYKVLLADWHAFLNRKLEGDMEKIRQAAEYFIKGWDALGVKNVEYIYASKLLEEKPDYWEKVMKISMNTTFKRVIRCLPIMGRVAEKYEGLAISSFLYPLMQCADIFELEVDITQLGMDQRHANMLAREIAPTMGYSKPVAVHHHLLMGLIKAERMGYDADTAIDAQISAKQSKSRPESAIFIHDTPEEIKQKIKRAYCPIAQTEENPIIEIVKYIFLRENDSILEIKRKAEHGGDLTVTLPELLDLYQKELIHPQDLKNAVAENLIEMLAPARTYFEDHPKYLEIFKTTQITR